MRFDRIKLFFAIRKANYKHKKTGKQYFVWRFPNYYQVVRSKPFIRKWNSVAQKLGVPRMNHIRLLAECTYKTK